LKQIIYNHVYIKELFKKYKDIVKRYKTLKICLAYINMAADRGIREM